MCGAYKPRARRSGIAESWSILRKRWRPGWVSCVNDSAIVPSQWRWSNRGELWCSCWPSMSPCVCSQCRRRWLPICGKHCTHWGAKDDPRDADLLLDLLLQHRDKLRGLSPDTEATRRVQNLVEERRELEDEKTEQSNRLTSHLKIYFPQILDW